MAISTQTGKQLAIKFFKMSLEDKENFLYFNRSLFDYDDIMEMSTIISLERRGLFNSNKAINNL